MAVEAFWGLAKCLQRSANFHAMLWQNKEVVTAATAVEASKASFSSDSDTAAKDLHMHLAHALCTQQST